ncbi:hypothetical protein BC332_13049 [Capsicum chinense]|nr:hypothetical protein BC332_13049 [Capsicum chinense]
MLVDLAVFSAEATATEATAMATSKALSLTNRSTIAVRYAWSFEPVALGLTLPCLSHLLELDTILDKNALFKVVVKSHNVERHVEDPDFNCEKVAAETHEITDSNPDNNLNTPTNTPTKRSLLEVESLGIEVEDDSNAQLSSTNLNKVVKKEKRA